MPKKSKRVFAGMRRDRSRPNVSAAGSRRLEDTAGVADAAVAFAFRLPAPRSSAGSWHESAEVWVVMNISVHFGGVFN